MKTDRGTSADYLTRRIAKLAQTQPEARDILDRMKAGEFPSVRKAALEAGIVKPTITIPLDPERAARLLRKHFRGDDWNSLRLAMDAQQEATHP